MAEMQGGVPWFFLWPAVCSSLQGCVREALVFLGSDILCFGPVAVMAVITVHPWLLLCVRLSHSFVITATSFNPPMEDGKHAVCSLPGPDRFMVCKDDKQNSPNLITILDSVRYG